MHSVIRRFVAIFGQGRPRHSVHSIPCPGALPYSAYGSPGRRRPDGARNQINSSDRRSHRDPTGATEVPTALDARVSRCVRDPLVRHHRDVREGGLLDVAAVVGNCRPKTPPESPDGASRLAQPADGSAVPQRQAGSGRFLRITIIPSNTSGTRSGAVCARRRRSLPT